MLVFKKIWFGVMLFFGFFSFSQDDLKVKTGTFDYAAFGRMYEYTGEYVMSKESGSKEKLPHGKGTLKQPEKLDKALVDVDIPSIEKVIKKGYNPEPYLYDGEWYMGKKNGVGRELIFSYIQDGMRIATPKISEYVGSFKDDVFDGNGSLKIKELDYNGEFKNGKFEGFGKIVYRNKDTYEGEFIANEYHGKGTFVSFDSKETFKGTFENHAFKKGLYIYKDGNTYDGDWKDGLPSGNGTFTWKKTGDVYTGDFLSGEPNGQGKLTQKDGSYFEGVFADGDCTGKAKMNLKSKFYEFDLKYIEFYGVYEGNVIKSIPNGLGTFKSMKNVSYSEYDDEGNEIKKQVPAYTYIGEWKDGTKNGVGKLEVNKENEYDTESLSYEGNFKNDFFDDENGVLNQNYSYGAYHSYTGSFKSGQFNGFGKLESSTEGQAYSYEGQFLKGEFHGEGSYNSENGIESYIQKGTFQNGYMIQGVSEHYQGDEKPASIYTGSFVEGIASGKGKIEYFANLDEYLQDWSKNKVKSYEGDWANGEPNGQGTVIYKNGTKITGNFRNGEYVKPFAPSSVKIGNQTWMAENLTVTTFKNGDPIPEAKTKVEWEAAWLNRQPAFCYYNNDPSNAKTRGVLYNYFAVNDSRGLAPEGWRVPSHVDIENLFKIEFPNYYSDWKVIKDKEAQGLNTKVDRDKLAIKYRINPVTLVSVKTFSNQHKTCFHRDEFGNFKDNDSYGPVFWSSSYMTNQDSHGVNIGIVKTVGNSAKTSIQVSEMKPIETSARFGTPGEWKGIGYPVRLLKTN